MAYFYIMLVCIVVLAMTLSIAWFLVIDDIQDGIGTEGGEVVAVSFLTALLVFVIYIFCTDVPKEVKLDGMAQYDRGEYVKEVIVKEVYTDGALTKVDSVITFIKKID